MPSWIKLFFAIRTITAIASAHPTSQKVLKDSQQSLQPQFGIGFDLTASYGSVAVSFDDGTIVTLATIPAEEGYREVFQRLSLDSSQHPSPPYNNIDESWRDMLRQWKRKARKAIGLPASTDVGYLSTMLGNLRAAAEEQVGSIKSGAVTTMNLVALYDEDILDAFEFAGLEYIAFPVGSVGHNLVYETSAAFAGYGFGLCADYKTSIEQCKQEQYNMTDETVMAVLYTDNVLTISLSVVKSAYYLWEPQYRYRTNFDLGYDNINEQGYWDKVEAELKQLMIQNPNYRRPSKVLLIGDRTDDRGFEMKLRAALAEETYKRPVVLGKEAAGVAAKGVAEMAKRKSYHAPQ